MSDQEISRCPECGDTALQESHGLFSTCHVCHESYSPHSEEMGFERTSWEEWSSSMYGDDKEEVSEGLAVLASPAMTMQMQELQEWMDYYGLGLSISFTERTYKAELRQPVGDGSSVAIVTTRAADFSVAIIAACENYQRMQCKAP